MITTVHQPNQSNTLSSAALARERLRSVVSQQRDLRRKNPGYLPALKTALMEVLCKHAEVNADQVGIHVTRNDVYAVTLQMSVKCSTQSPETQSPETQSPKPPRRRLFSRFASS